jgi:hypothetical protein
MSNRLPQHQLSEYKDEYRRKITYCVKCGAEWPLCTVEPCEETLVKDKKEVDGGKEKD